MTGITHTEDVTPSNTVDLQHECSAIYVGTGGDVAGVETNGGVSLYKNVPSGAYIYGIFRRVNATGTNAADMIASRGLVPFVHSAAKTSITEWNAATTYYIDDVRLHNGGIWSSNTTNLDSEPISGNADWTLVGGTPYVENVFPPNQLTIAPFLDIAQTGTGVISIPDPGAGIIVWPLYQSTTWSAGDVWGQNPTLHLNYGAPDNNGGGTTSLTPNTPTGLQLGLGISIFTTDSFNIAAYPVAHVPVVIYSTVDPSDGGTGTQTLTVRTFYTLIPEGAS